MSIWSCKKKKLPLPKQEKNWSHMFWVNLTLLNGVRSHVAFCVLIFIFWLEPDAEIGNLDENDFHTVMVVFSKLPFWKLLLHSCVQSSFSIITRHYWQQYFERWRVLEHWWGYALILSLRRDKTKIDEVAWKIVSGTKIRACILKNIAPKEITFHLFLYASLSLKQT